MLRHSDENRYVLKVTGENSYVHGSYELMEFAYVIRCLIKKTDIDLALVERLDPSIDKLRDIEDVSGLLSLFFFLVCLLIFFCMRWNFLLTLKLSTL